MNKINKNALRPLFVAMQKNEGEMIFAWAKYHANLFGVNSVVVFDNGSTCQNTLKFLNILSDIGVNIIKEFNEPIHFEEKGKILGDYFKYRRHEYDFFIPLDADEFLVVSTKDGFSCGKLDVKKELQKYLNSDYVLKIKSSYYNIPYSIKRFFLYDEDKVFFSSRSFASVDMGFHYGSTINGFDEIKTNLMHIHLCHKPLWKVKQDALNKLKVRCKETDLLKYAGPGQHLIKYFTMSEIEYEKYYGDGELLTTFSEATDTLGLNFNFFVTKDNNNEIKNSTLEHIPNYRGDFVKVASRLAKPILVAYSIGELPKQLPLYCSKGKEKYFYDVASLEAIGRLFCGISPWLQSADSDALPLLQSLIEGIEYDARTNDPQLKWDRWQQNLVDASYFAIGLINAPRVFNELSQEGKKFIKNGLEAALMHKPFDNNWVLMPPVINLCLDKYWGGGDIYSIEKSLRLVNSWYIGDGYYKDGPFFASDYYNSFVFHPFLLELDSGLKSWSGNANLPFKINSENLIKRSQRYATLLEKLASKDGDFPIMGRSITYRTGILFILSYLAYRGLLPEKMSNGSVRSLLFSLIEKTLITNKSFNFDGFLRPGFNGNQPLLAEDYITSGSLYMSALVFFVLGLPENHPFWVEPKGLWTGQKINMRTFELEKNDMSLERAIGYKSTSFIT